MKEYDIYVFDLDGTLLDTLADLTNATNAAMREMGFPPYTMRQVRMMVGNGVRTLMERAVPQGAGHPMFEETLSFFRQYYLAHGMENTRPYDGVTEMLERLRRRGKRVAVVSNKFDHATKDLCRHFFAPWVEVAVGETEGRRKKPAPDTVIEALDRLGATTHESVVYIGDSDVDIQTAANCHIPCVSVLWGFRDRQFLIDHGAETLVRHPLQLTVWMSK